jgi:omega-6 fatty acid desaturase (delta-12 desaturase)
MINDLVGLPLHSFLLVPYYAWKYTHAKHHKYTNHLIHGETHVPSTL